MFSELEAACQKEAASQSISLPAQFSAEKLCDEERRVEFNGTVLSTVDALQHQGMKCIADVDQSYSHLQKSELPGLKC